MGGVGNLGGWNPAAWLQQVQQQGQQVEDGLAGRVQMARDQLLTSATSDITPTAAALAAKVADAWPQASPDQRRTAVGMAHDGAADWQEAIADRRRYQGPPQGPFPSMTDLKAKFPEANLPDRMVGTTMDDGLWGKDPDQLMAKCQAMGFNTVRVAAYMDRIMPDEGSPDRQEPDWSYLDALMAAAQRHGIHIVLSVGAKAPSWPEYHLVPGLDPKHDRVDPARDPSFAARTEQFVQQAVDRYKDAPALAMWQVENEPFYPAGPEELYLDKDFVAKEANLIKQADAHRHPLMINCWSSGSEKGHIEEAFQIADAVGLDVYGHTPEPDPTGATGLLSWHRTVGMPAWTLELAKKTGKPAMITELQADDWSQVDPAKVDWHRLPELLKDPQHHLDVLGAEDYKTNPQDVASLTHGLEHLGYRDMLFWRLDTNLAREAAGHDDLSAVETQLAAEDLGKPA